MNSTPVPPTPVAAAVDEGGDAPQPPLSRVPGWLVRAGLTAWLGLGLVAAAVALYLAISSVRALVTPLVVASVIGMLFYPLVDRLTRSGLARGGSAGLVLLGITAVAVGSVWLAVRGIIDQGDEIAASLESGWIELQTWLESLGVNVDELNSLTDSLTSSIGSAGSGLGGLVQSTFSSLASFLIGLFIGTFLLFYLLKDWHTLIHWLAGHVGLPQDLGEGLIDDATRAIRQYFYGLTLASIPIAIVIGLAMWVLDLPLAFTVALVTFVTAYIPYLGAIFSGAFAVLVALGSGGIVDAAIILVVILLTQNVLQTVMLTKITSDQLSLHPIVNLGSTIIGATLAGILGATLSAPLVASVIAARKRLTNYAWAQHRPDSGDEFQALTDVGDEVGVRTRGRTGPESGSRRIRRTQRRGGHSKG